MNIGYRIPSKKIDAEPSERTLDLRQYLNFVWRNWMFIASVTAFVLLVGLIYLVRATPLYTAATQVLLEQREKAPGLDAIVNDGGIGSDYYLENQLAILRSDSLLRRVAIKELAPPSTKELGGRGAKQRGSGVGGSSHQRWYKSAAGSFRGFAWRASSDSQHRHHLGRSDTSRAARQRGGRCLRRRPA